MTEIIKVDCLVSRTSGGPVMLVLGVYGSQRGTGPAARCAWFDGHRLVSETITINHLVLVPAPLDTVAEGQRS